MFFYVYRLRPVFGVWCPVSAGAMSGLVRFLLSGVNVRFADRIQCPSC